MSKYPDVISDEILEMYSHIPDQELARDVAITEREVGEYSEVMAAELSLAGCSPSATDRKLAAFKARARPGQIEERQDFIAFLRRVQNARARLGAA